jgi:hypothetical protein
MEIFIGLTRKVARLTHASSQLNIRGGHFLTEDPALFDANFFNLSSEVAAVCTITDF